MGRTKALEKIIVDDSRVRFSAVPSGVLSQRQHLNERGEDTFTD